MYGIFNAEKDAEWTGILQNGKRRGMTSLIKILLRFCPTEHMDLI